MNDFCLVIDTDELSYSVHDRYCSQVADSTTPGKIVNFAVHSGQEDDLVHAQKNLLPSWDFRPCNCLRVLSNT